MSEPVTKTKEQAKQGLRPIADPYPAPGPTGVAVRIRLKGLTERDERVLRLVGAHLGSLACADLKARCAHGLDHDRHTWSARKRELTPESSARWAGAITKATHDQWALARRGQVAYRIGYDVERERWYLTAPWQIPTTPEIPLQAALAAGVVGVDTSADHLAAWHLDTHGNPVGDPRRFDYELSGTAEHRDAQVRHALSRLLRWAQACGVRAIAVDAAYTSRWGVQHWQKPTTSKKRTTSRPRCGEHRDRAARSGVSGPASDGTAPHPPE